MNSPAGQRPGLPRYLPDEPLPARAYVPGLSPRPARSGAGTPSAPPGIDAWPRCREYLRGIDLFNHGYYWEAHEAWEALWQAASRGGPGALFLQGLIKLAAAGVKWRQENAAGVSSHARRAAELFAEVAGSTGRDRFLGLELEALSVFASSLAGDCRAMVGQDSSAFVPLILSLALPKEP